MDVWVKQFTKILAATTISFLGIFIVLFAAYTYIPIYFYKLLFSLLTFLFLIAGSLFISIFFSLLRFIKKERFLYFLPSFCLLCLRGCIL